MQRQPFKLLIALTTLALTTTQAAKNFAEPLSPTTVDPHFRSFPLDRKDPLAPRLHPRKRFTSKGQAKKAPRIIPAPAWIQIFGSALDDESKGVATDGKGSVFITGHTDRGDRSNIDNRTSAWAARYNRTYAWVAKYSSVDGSLLWKTRLDAGYYDFSNGVTTDEKGNFLVTGSTTGQLGSQSYGAEDAWVAKYSTVGTLLWLKQLGSYEYEGSNSVATDGKGNVFISGWANGTLGSQNYGNRDAWVAKYSAAGKLLWIKQLGSSENEESNGTATDKRGNVYIAGLTYGKLGDKQYGYIDAWVAKYSPGGALLWKKQLGSKQRGSDAMVAIVKGVATDGAGNVFISGWTNGRLGNQSYGGRDAWVTKYSSDGILQWTRQLGTTSDDESAGVATDGAGNIYISGSTGGQLGDQEYGYDDAWVAKYSSSGKLLWTKQLGSIYGGTYSNGVAADKVGNVYVSGPQFGPLGDRQYGGDDAWVAKYSADEPLP